VGPSGQEEGARAPVGAVHHAESSSAAADEGAPKRGPVVLDLELEGGFPLLTWAPAGRGEHPVVVTAHGAGCLAEEDCDYLWRLTSGKAIVACLRGEPLFRTRPEQGFYFRDHLALGRELGLAVAALRTEFGERLGDDWTFAGYSQGATMGALALPESTRAFQQLLLIEGGGEGMTRKSAERLREQGTKRVLFACGNSGCAKRGEQTAVGLRAVGLDVRVVHAEGAGHTYLGAVEEEVSGELGWFWPPR